MVGQSIPPTLEGTILNSCVGGGVVEFLHVRRNDHGGGGALGQRDPDRAVENIGQLFGNGDHLHVVAGDVLVQAEQIHLLLVGAAHGGAVGLSDDRHDGHVVEFGVVKAVEQMHRTGPPRGGDAHADPPPLNFA